MILCSRVQYIFKIVTVGDRGDVCIYVCKHILMYTLYLYYVETIGNTPSEKSSGVKGDHFSNFALKSNILSMFNLRVPDNCVVSKKSDPQEPRFTDP